MNNKASVYMTNRLPSQSSDIKEYGGSDWTGTMSVVGFPNIHVSILMNDFIVPGSTIGLTGKTGDVAGRITIKGFYADYERVGAVG